MAAKSIKGKNAGGKSAPNSGNEIPKKEPAKAKNELEDDEEFLDEEDETESIKGSSKKTAKTTSKKGKEEDDDDEQDEKEVVDEWEKPEEEPEEWDPDFEEFDLPKSKAKKSGVAGGKKGVKGPEEEEELGLDEEFKDLDLFNERGFDDDEEDF